MPTVLIVDDEPQLRKLLARTLGLEGFEVEEADSGGAALRKLVVRSFDAVICDVRLPDANGVELTAAIKMRQPSTEVIVLTAFGTIRDAVRAVQNGAFQYLVKGDDNVRLLPTLNEAIAKAAQHRRPAEIAEKDPFSGITGRSPAIQQAIELARKVAATTTTVLLTGATGTGKEVFATAIHAAGPRAGKPLLALNCGALSRDLLESELFGHAAGAFTGAVKEKKGLLDAAKGGTLFLDEIGEMPPELQAKLLRVLETGDYLRVGDTTPRRSDVRIIAATHRDLQQEVAAGRFREDLYYRLSTFIIRLPALVERRADIPLLAQVFLDRFARTMGKPITGLEEAVKERLMAYAWPGQVRELRNVIERGCILCDGPLLDLASLPLEVQGAAVTEQAMSSYDLESVEREHIRRVLAHTGGNKTLTAELLGIGVTTLYAKVKKYGL